MNRTRLLIVAAIVVLAAIVAAVAIVVATPGGSSSSSSSAQAVSTQTTGAGVPAGPVAVLSGVPQHGDLLGTASAPVTLEVFEDPQCPFCREWALQAFPTVVQNYVKSGRIRLQYRGVEIIGPNSQPGLRAIYAAGQQDKLWNLVEELYERQGKENSGWITTGVLRSAATAVGANADEVLAQSSSPKVTAQLRRAASDFQAAGAQGTPTFVLLRPPSLPQQLQVTGLDAASFTSALDAALQ